MRTLIINSMFTNALYRRCADELGVLPGMDLTMLTLDGWMMNGKPMALDEIVAGAPYRSVIGKGGWKGFENRGFYTSGIRKAISLSQPEVIYLMEEPFSLFTLEVLAHRTLMAPRTPVVFFTWNNLSLERFDYRPSIFYRNVARRTLPRMQYAVTANSDAITVLRGAGFDRPARTLGYGVDTEAFSAPRPDRAQEVRKHLNIEPRDTLIAFVGRLIHMKGVDLLIDAFAELTRKHPERSFKLLLLGGGEEEGDLRDRAVGRGVGPLVRHVKVVPAREVPDYMHALDILVLPSRRVGMWAEQFGRVIIEAMSAGRIVIGSSSGAIPEVIGDAGLVFQEEDTTDLLATLERAVTLTPVEHAGLRSRAIDRAVNGYSWARFARDSYDVLQEAYRGGVGG